MQQTAKYMMAGGALLLLAGIVFFLLGDKLWFLGRLPGDIRIKRGNVSFYFPITTMLLVSGVLNLVLWLLRKLQ